MYAMATRLKDGPPGELPDALVLLGDQIYAHKPPFDTLDFIRSRRDTNRAPGEAVADFRNAKPLSRVYQAVCCPLGNSLPGKKSRLQSVAWNGAALAARLLSRLAGVEREDLTWRLTHDEPFFDNQVATLELDGPEATITFEGPVLDGSGEPGLRRLYSRRLA